MQVGNHVDEAVHWVAEEKECERATLSNLGSIMRIGIRNNS